MVTFLELVFPLGVPSELPEHAASSPTVSAPALASAAILRRDVIVFLLVGRMDARVVMRAVRAACRWCGQAG
jgi:hypothetical protein